MASGEAPGAAPVCFRRNTHAALGEHLKQLYATERNQFLAPTSRGNFFFQIKNALCKLKMNKYQSLFCYIVSSSNIFYLLRKKNLGVFGVLLATCHSFYNFLHDFCQNTSNPFFFRAVENKDARMQTTLRKDRWKKN